MKIILGFIFSTLIPCLSFARADFYSGMSLGNVTMAESHLGNQFNHSSAFFVGHFGFDLGLRAHVDFGNLGIGFIGEVGWVGDSLERKQVNTNGTSTNRFESYRLIGGGSLYYALSKTGGITAEYYPTVENTITYSDNGANNPFRQNDKLKTTGYGIGINYSFSDKAPTYVMYRRFSYKDVQMGGVNVTLPTARYTTEFVVEDLLVAILKSF